jgi:thiol-disulfide isomerase/thioredoxin
MPGKKNVMRSPSRVILSLSLLGLSELSAGGELTRTEPATPAPELELPDLSGRQHRLRDYRGQVVLVNFWASWCPPCLAEMPSMQRLSEVMKGRPFRILAVNVEESKSTVWKFRKLLNLSFTTLLDSAGEVAETWEVELFPSSYVIDAEGRLSYRVRGALQWDDAGVITLLEALMPEQDPAETLALQRKY